MKHVRLLDMKHRQLRKLTVWLVFVGMRLPRRLNVLRADLLGLVSTPLSSMSLFQSATHHFRMTKTFDRAEPEGS
eukprot:COSAG02_NODE_661_length_18757_cov_4.427699_15_plen_75_part_00